MSRVFRGVALCFLLLPGLLTHAGDFEDLGTPVRTTSVHITAVTSDGQGKTFAWGTVSGDKVRQLIGFDVATGKKKVVDLLGYRESNIQMTLARNGSLYLYSGNPGHFLRYNPQTGNLTDLGVPNSATRYWLGDVHAVGPDDVFYVGTFPEARLVAVRMQTDQILDLGRLAEDDRQRYLINPAVSDDNIVYAPVGLHHRELWSVNPSTKEKRQILPGDLQKGYGAPVVWTAVDGRVYGRLGGTTFLCQPDRIVTGPAPAPREYPERTAAGDLQVRDVDEQGRLVLKPASGPARFLQTDFQGIGETIFCLGDVADGWLFGSAIKPGKSFAIHLKTGEIRSLGYLTTGHIQVYDFLHHERGLFAASYTGGCLDLLNVDAALRGRPGQSIIRLAPRYGQERPVQLHQGPDGGVYTVTTPVKGHLGGALVRIDPGDLSTRVWRDLIPDQSLSSLASVKQTGELFVTSDVRGGTGARPTASAAAVFLWNPGTEKVVFQTRPVPGVESYGTAVAARTGLIYGTAQKQYYAFDPVKRETVHVAPLPAGALRFPGLHPEPIGPDGLIYGLSSGSIIAIDPRDHSARVVAKHPSLRSAQGLFVTADKVLYYGSGATVMRYQLP